MKSFVALAVMTGALLLACTSRCSAFSPSLIQHVSSHPKDFTTGATPQYKYKNPKALSAIAFDPRYHQNNGGQREERFERSASQESQAQAPCIILVDGISYNLTAWAKAHPGGEKILLKFHGKDATKAFHAAGHSKMAVEMLKDFAITDAPVQTSSTAAATATATFDKKIPRWRQKLFTKEDPIGIHKYMGIFVLLHFIFRFRQMYFGDPSCGLGTRLGKGPSLLPALCLIPHAVLSLSSLIFHTVPIERVVGRPMIWAEYRIHNIGFGVRSVVAAFLAFSSYYFNHAPAWRRVAIWGSGISVIAAQIVADIATKRLRVNDKESTTATMPYWPGCSIQTQKRFKSFYAYCQFLATLACLAVGNPGWPLSVLLAIQMASLLMTLVRKGLLSARGYHIGYTITLIMPWFVGLRSLQHGSEFLGMAGLGWILYQLRRRGINKYALWVPVIAARILWGDQFLHWDVY
jgi:cytochrome b involved in lipid metabolism